VLEALRENFTIVVVGNWNVSIFNPGWVGKNIFDSKTVTLEVGIGPELPRRLIVDDVIVIPQSSRLMVTPNKIDNTTLKRMEDAVCKILELLSHTPVSAVGVNFGFRIKPLAGSFSNIPALLAEELASEGLSIESHEIKWTVGHESTRKTILNLSVQIGTDEALIKFNFHSDTENTAKAIESIKDKVIGYRDKALSVLVNVFRVELEG
jgi:hypothetical protein